MIKREKAIAKREKLERAQKEMNERLKEINIEIEGFLHLEGKSMGEALQRNALTKEQAVRLSALHQEKKKIFKTLTKVTTKINELEDTLKRKR